jgi:hypothetical protein
MAKRVDGCDGLLDQDWRSKLVASMSAFGP